MCKCQWMFQVLTLSLLVKELSMSCVTQYSHDCLNVHFSIQTRFLLVNLLLLRLWMGMKVVLAHWRCWGEYLDIWGMKWYDPGENLNEELHNLYVLTIITWMIKLISWAENVAHMGKQCIQSFCRKIWKKETIRKSYIYFFPYC